MTKKHFEAIAALMNHARKEQADAEQITRMLAHEFQRFNPHFDPERFIKASGVE